MLELILLPGGRAVVVAVTVVVLVVLPLPTLPPVGVVVAAGAVAHGCECGGGRGGSCRSECVVSGTSLKKATKEKQLAKKWTLYRFA